MENFTKKLDSTDVQRRLTLPENCLKDFQGDHEANLKFKEEEGQVWTFVVECHQEGVQNQPFLGTGFHLFVKRVSRPVTL